MPENQPVKFVVLTYVGAGVGVTGVCVCACVCVCAIACTKMVAVVNQQVAG